MRISASTCIRYVSDAPKTQPARGRDPPDLIEQAQCDRYSILGCGVNSVCANGIVWYLFYFRDGASFNEGRRLDGIDIGAARTSAPIHTVNAKQLGG
jgi:hypothetical protein